MSGLVDDRFSAIIRIQLVTTTLFHYQEATLAYHKHSKNLRASKCKNKHQCQFLVSRESQGEEIGMGNSKMMISVAIEKPAFTYQLLVISVQVPGIVFLHLA